MANIFRRRKIKRPSKSAKSTPPAQKEQNPNQPKVTAEPTTSPVKKKSFVLRRKKEKPPEENLSVEETQEATKDPVVEEPIDTNLEAPQETAKPNQEAKPEDTVVLSSEQPEHTTTTESQETEPEQQTSPTVDQTTEQVPEQQSQSQEVAQTEEPKPKRFTKLGKAVIAPPPNYQPNAVRKKKETKTERENRQSQSSTTGQKDRPAKATTSNWKDNSKETKDDKLGKAKKQRRRGKEKNNKIHHQRIEMRLDDIPQTTNRRRRTKGKNTQQKKSPKAKAIKRRIFIDKSISVGNLAHSMSIKSAAVIKKLVQLGQIYTINDDIDFETAQLVAEEFEYEVINTAFKEDELLITEQPKDVNTESRPAVVTIMGHVDHGKTTLLDYIRKSNVADGEAGGITQHVSAYQVRKNDQLITFIDTPGHEAFTAMRSRGAQVTDIVILVVAADDGIMPQTLEALSHAKAAGVQIMVAVNKCDRPNANPMNVRQQMMQHELIPEEYGGETIFVDISALQGTGVNDLIDNLILLSEMGEYSAVIQRHAEGTVLEARLDKGRGPVATLIVQHGTLKIGDSLVIGDVVGRVRALNDYNGKRLKSAGPSSPVEVIGLQAVPVAGESFTVVKSDKDARKIAEHRREEKKNQTLNKPKKLTLEDLLSMQNQEETVALNLIIKSDVGGTLEAIKASLDKINVPGTEVKILHDGVGAITEGDISLAHTYNGIVLGFNVRPDSKARKAENELNVEVRTYKVIYEALEDIEKALKGLLSPETKEAVQGLAEIRKTFAVPKVGTVAGCYVLEGKISRNHKVRLLRESVVIWEGKLASLQRFKDAVREVEKGYECGMNLDGFNDIKVGDQIETYIIEEVDVS